jgi:hypothetical protein
MASKTIEAVELPMPLDTLIKVGMLADVDGHGDGLPIEGISIALCPRRDGAAEGTSAVLVKSGGGDQEEIPATAVEVGAIEAALLPYAVFDLGRGGWAYGRQVRRVHEGEGDEAL